MANKQKPPSSRTMGSQKNHKAVPSRQKHPDRKLLKIIQSSGPELAVEYAKHFGLQGELRKPYFIEAVERFHQRKADRRAGLQTQNAPETQPQAE